MTDWSTATALQENLRPLLEESAEDLYEEAPCGYLSTLAGGELVKVNRTLLSWTGYTREQLVGRRFQDLLTPGGKIYHETHYAPLLRMQGTVREIALELVCADGRRLPVLVNSVLRTDDQGQPLLVRTTVFDATHRRAYERELLAARERERAARQRTERLQRLSTALAAAVDAEQMAGAVLGELADSLGADHVSLALVQPDSGRLEVIGRRGHGTAGTAAGTGFDHDALESAMRERRPRFWSAGEPDDAATAPGGAASGAFEALAALPLLVRHEPIGAVCLSFAAARGFDEEQRSFLEACAGQCGQALERARLYETQRTVAHALQQSLLAGEPPQDPSVAIATCYLPAVETLDVGGDWHDAFTVSEGTIGVVVGDVVGRGIEAATSMGQLRSATRALAGAELGPARVLAGLERFATSLPRARMATLAYAEVDLRTGMMRYACAGHPPPLLLQPSGGAALLWGGRSTPLGVALGDRGHDEGQVELLPGARLVLYTDGLVESRRASIDVGLARLADELEARRATPVESLAGELVRALVGEDQPPDDVCVLCLDYGMPGSETSPRDGRST